MSQTRCEAVDSKIDGLAILLGPLLFAEGPAASLGPLSDSGGPHPVGKGVCEI